MVTILVCVSNCVIAVSECEIASQPNYLVWHNEGYSQQSRIMGLIKTHLRPGVPYILKSSKTFAKKHEVLRAMLKIHQKICNFENCRALLFPPSFV